MPPCSTLARTVVALLAIAYSNTLVAADDVGKPIGEQLYSSTFKDLKDQSTSMDQFKGKVLVMYYWATWCVPCRVETPNLVKLNEQYKDKGVVVVGLALDNGDKVRDFVRENNVTYPIFYGGRDAVQLGKAMGRGRRHPFHCRHR